RGGDGHRADRKLVSRADRKWRTGMGIPAGGGGSRVKRTGPALLPILIFLLASLTKADRSQAQEREFPFSVAAVERALQQLGAYRGARLPSLSGFIEAERAGVPNYERPYYEFKLD